MNVLSLMLCHKVCACVMFLSSPSSGVVVGLSNSIKAFCPKLQLSDNLKLKKVGAMFTVGSAVKCRVLVNSVVSGKRQLIVTHKKSLIDSVLPILASYDDAVVGEPHHGFLTSVRANGCVVKFFNNVQAFVPRSHLSAVDDVQNPERLFSLGQTVKAFVLNVDVAQNRMLATLKPGVVSASQASAQLAAAQIGSLVEVVVLEHTEQGQ